MAKNAANIRIGQCDVYLDKGDGNGERDLGHSMGGVEFNFEREFKDLTVDQYGNTPVDMALTGQNLTIKVVLAEPTTENLGDAIPEGTYAEQGSDSKLSLGQNAGQLMKALAGQLRLHPVANIPSSRDEDIYIFKAVSIEAVPLEFKVDTQRVLEITFRALVDESQGVGERLGRIGDTDIS